MCQLVEAESDDVRRLDFHGVTYESVTGTLDRTSRMIAIPLDGITELLA
jgi:hypothetical protein